jgi:hypothetical protein
LFILDPSSLQKPAAVVVMITDEDVLAPQDDQRERRHEQTLTVLSE